MVLFSGIAVALAANQISPRGLVLTRNYFPAGTGQPAPAAATAGQRRDAAGSPAISPAELLAARWQAEGLRLVDGAAARRLFNDSRHQPGKILFIDARDEAHYQAGHLPGACEFDPYRPEKYFPAALPACQAADQIVVYCHGGDCDDSESAALMLRDVGIPLSKLFIYGGGITEWSANGLPLETGERNGGSLRHPNP